jgi:hypothetical protein
MKVGELIKLLECSDPENDVVVGKIENNQFKTAYIPESCAIMRKKNSDEVLTCIFYTKTLKKVKKDEKGELN